MDISVQLSGYVGSAVELTPTRSGLPWLTFRVASTPRIQRDGVYSDGVTSWVTVACFKSLAENAAQSLSKGDPVIVWGRLRTQSWVEPNTNETRERQVLEATAIGHDLNRGTSQFAKTRRETAIDTPVALTTPDGQVSAASPVEAELELAAA